MGTRLLGSSLRLRWCVARPLYLGFTRATVQQSKLRRAGMRFFARKVRAPLPSIAMEVAELRERLDDFLGEVRLAELRYLQGAAGELSYAASQRAFPELCDAESVAQLAAAANAPARTELGKRRLRRLQRFLADRVAARVAGEATERLTRTLSQARVQAGQETITAREASLRLFREDEREKRTAWAAALSRLRLEEGAFGRRVEALGASATQLGAPSYPALVEALDGVSFEEVGAQGASAMARTSDAYRDVLDFALRRLDPRLRGGPRGQAQLHDLLRLSVAPWILPDLHADDALTTVVRWLREWGLDPYAGKRIRVDLDEGATHAAGMRAIATAAPRTVHLVGAQLGGLRDFAELASASGAALLLAAPPADAQVEDRWLADPTFSHAIQALLGGVVADPAWIRRYLGASQPVAREAARLGALCQAGALRLRLVELDHERALYVRGVSGPVLDEFVDRVKASLFVGCEAGAGLDQALAPFSSAHAVRGAALAERLRRHAEERFNEDWWRNPAAATWLGKLLGDGVRDEPDEVARAHGGPGSLEEHAARLLHALAA